MWFSQTKRKGANKWQTETTIIWKNLRIKNDEKITAYFNMSGRSKKVNVNGDVIFSLNCKDNRLLNNAALVVKNIN